MRARCKLQLFMCRAADFIRLTIINLFAVYHHPMYHPTYTLDIKTVRSEYDFSQRLISIDKSRHTLFSCKRNGR